MSTEDLADFQHVRLDPAAVSIRPAPGSPGDTPEAHLARVLAMIQAELPAKYRTGQGEHGGVLSRKPVLGELGAEILDLVVYYATLREQAHRLTALLASAVASRNWTEVQRALNLLIVGNEEGQR